LLLAKQTCVPCSDRPPRDWQAPSTPKLPADHLALARECPDKDPPELLVRVIAWLELAGDAGYNHSRHDRIAFTLVK
jgi:hypothetical protein